MGRGAWALFVRRIAAWDKSPYALKHAATTSAPVKAPRKYFDPLAIGAPRPLLELPSRLERMIHFVPPHNEKVRAKAGELVGQVDVVLGNLEDAIPVDAEGGRARRLDRDGEGDRFRRRPASGRASMR